MTHKCQAAAGHCTLRVSYDSNSEVRNSTKLEGLAVAKQQVVIDPTTKRNVWLHDQFDQCTTRHIGVLVSTTALEVNDSSAVLDVSNDVISTVRVTVTNNLVVEEFVEHKKWKSVNNLRPW